MTFFCHIDYFDFQFGAFCTNRDKIDRVDAVNFNWVDRFWKSECLNRCQDGKKHICTKVKFRFDLISTQYLQKNWKFSGKFTFIANIHIFVQLVFFYFWFLIFCINGEDFHGLSRFRYTQLGTQVASPRCARLGIRRKFSLLQRMKANQYLSKIFIWFAFFSNSCSLNWAYCIKESNPVAAQQLAIKMSTFLQLLETLTLI